MLDPFSQTTITLREYLRYKRYINDQMEHQRFRERGNNLAKFLTGEKAEQYIKFSLEPKLK